MKELGNLLPHGQIPKQGIQHENEDKVSRSSVATSKSNEGSQ